MTVCSAANLRRAALLIAKSADIARDRKKQEPLARRYSDTEKSQGIATRPKCGDRKRYGTYFSRFAFSATSAQ
jgi:hypothetical protein